MDLHPSHELLQIFNNNIIVFFSVNLTDFNTGVAWYFKMEVFNSALEKYAYWW